MNIVNVLGQQLEKFRVIKDEIDEVEHEKDKEKQVADSTLLGVEESLKRKQKGQRVSYYERVYLLKQMKTSEKSLTEITIDSNISLGTLYNNRKKFNTPIKESALVKSSTVRNFVESPKIQNIIKDYLDWTRIPWSSKNIWAYIKA